MTRKFWDAMLRRMNRRERTVNRADPTIVTTYAYKGALVSVDITISWGVEVLLTLHGDEHTHSHQWRWYDAPFWVRVVNHLEDAHNRKQAHYDEDPTGRLGDYE